MKPIPIDQALHIHQQAQQLFDQSQVDAGIQAMAQTIGAQIENDFPLLLCVMNGGLYLTGQLMRYWDFPMTVDYVHATRYRLSTLGRNVLWKAYAQNSLQDRHVIIVDDIFDQGYTLEEIKAYCLKQGAKKCTSAFLIRKTHHRIQAGTPDYRYLGGHDGNPILSSGLFIGHRVNPRQVAEMTGKIHPRTIHIQILAFQRRVIGGTGLYAMMGGFTKTHQEIINTPYGEPSCPLVQGKLFDKEVVFLARHGFTHRLPPHKINYLANIWMLHKVGVRQIYAVNAVGSMNDACPPQSLVLPDQIIDYSWGREHTFYAEDLEKVVHVDFTQPYSQALRKTLLQARDNTGLTVVENAVYGCTQGPRLETAAEIRRLKRDGCDLVGMTGMPEAALARELSIDYASIAVVANWGAGIRQETISMAMIESALQQGMLNVETLLTEAIRIGA